MTTRDGLLIYIVKNFLRLYSSTLECPPALKLSVLHRQLNNYNFQKYSFLVGNKRVEEGREGVNASCLHS